MQVSNGILYSAFNENTLFEALFENIYKMLVAESSFTTYFPPAKNDLIKSESQLKK